MAKHRKMSGMTIDGIEVEDATKPLILHIREADCKSGKKDPSGCAAAKAACRIDGVIEARVYRTRTYLLMQSKGKKVWKRHNTPNSIRNELIAFDRGGSFEPDDYTLGIVGVSERLGATAGRLPVKGGKRSGRNAPHVVKGIRPLGPKGDPRRLRMLVK